MNAYNLLRLVGINSVPWSLKLFGLACMLVGRRRVIGVFVDPVLGCNIRCRMCYFSDPEKRKEMKGVMTPKQLDAMYRVLLPHALKLQIGCGAEPTLYKDLASIISAGKKAGVPYISITTNGQLIGSGKVDLMHMINAGLDEITLSMHGTAKEIYEDLMPGARFELLQDFLRQIAEARKSGHNIKLRVNFTVNSYNLKNLSGDHFFKVFDCADCMPDIVQLRPVQNLGVSDWRDFDLSSLKTNFKETFDNVVEQCHSRGVTCIAPTLEALDSVDDVQNGHSAIFEDVTYCYVSPVAFYHDDFNVDSDTFRSYHKRHRTASKLLRACFLGSKSRSRNVSKKLNYKIR